MAATPNKNKENIYTRAGVGKLRPAGRMWPLTTFCVARGALFKKYIPSL